MQTTKICYTCKPHNTPKFVSFMRNQFVEAQRSLLSESASTDCRQLFVQCPSNPWPFRTCAVQRSNLSCLTMPIFVGCLHFPSFATKNIFSWKTMPDDAPMHCQYFLIRKNVCFSLTDRFVCLLSFNRCLTTFYCI